MSEATRKTLAIAFEEGFTGTTYPGKIEEKTTRPVVTTEEGKVALKARGLDEYGSTWTITLEVEEALEVYLELGEALGRPFAQDSKGLRFELHGVEGEGKWFRLYECEHVTDGTYPLISQWAIPLGPHSNLILCRHCWAGIRGTVTEDLLKEVLKRLSPHALRMILAESLGREESEDEVEETFPHGSFRDVADS